MDQEVGQYLESHKYFVPTKLTVFQKLLINCFNIVQEYVETAVLSEYNMYSVRKETQKVAFQSNLSC